eukprot:3923595-Alexandrium_andersonii.AAC.1
MTSLEHGLRRLRNEEDMRDAQAVWLVTELTDGALSFHPKQAARVRECARDDAVRQSAALRDELGPP